MAGRIGYYGGVVRDGLVLNLASYIKNKEPEQ